MRVFITRFNSLPINEWEHSYVDTVIEEINLTKDKSFSLTDNPEKADIIIIIESNHYKNHRETELYLNEPLLIKHPNKIYCINYEDNPSGVLKGLYSSLLPIKTDPSLHLSWPALFLHNKLIYTSQNKIQNKNKKLLFSFTGSTSHVVREKLFSIYSSYTVKNILVKKVDRWFNHSEQDFEDYVSNIQNSSFSLCPRGHAPYTHRIAESMALGSVPVIIADDWIPFAIPDTGYYIQIPEDSIDKIPAILKDNMDRYDTLQKNSSDTWERHFSRRNRCCTAIERLISFHKAAPATTTYNFYRKRIKSFSFRRNNKFLFIQRLARRITRRVS